MWRLRGLKLQENPSNGWQDTAENVLCSPNQVPLISYLLKKLFVMSVCGEYEFSRKSLQRIVRNNRKELCTPSKVRLISNRSKPNLHRL
jgi:hypothetical protein